MVHVRMEHNKDKPKTKEICFKAVDRKGWGGGGMRRSTGDRMIFLACILIHSTDSKKHSNEHINKQ